MNHYDMVGLTRGYIHQMANHGGNIYKKCQKKVFLMLFGNLGD
jgi:hypothetical protein